MRVSYDSIVDVLYLNVGKPGPVEGDGLAGGVELDFSADTGEPCGVTVIGYQRNGWDKDLPKLARISGLHLSVSPAKVGSAIIKAMREPRDFAI